MSAAVWIGIAVLGGIGAILRFHVDAFIQSRVRSELPLGTLTVNLVGSFALGVLTGAGVAGDALLLAGTAVLGSFTTFSTWMLETERLAEDGDDGVAGLNVLLSTVAGLAAAALGWLVGAAS